MKKIALIALTVAISTVGCATSDEYRQYAEAQKSVAQARSMAEIARYSALAEIAKQGDTAAKVAAVMSLNQGNSGQAQQQMLNPPKSAAETALQWTSLLLPNLTQFYSISANRQIAITQSNNATALGTAQSNNATTTATNTANAFATIANTNANGMVSIAGKIQAPQPNITLSGTGVIGSGSYSTVANPVTTTTTSTANPVSTTTNNSTTP